MKKASWMTLGFVAIALGTGVDAGLWHESFRPHVGTVYAVGRHDLPPNSDAPVGGAPNSAPPAAILPNLGKPTWWNTSSADFHLEMSAASFLFPNDERLLAVKPNQAVYLMASAHQSLPSVVWQASKGGHVSSNDDSEIWRLGGRTVQMGIFRAKKPGVYTVRAVDGRESSVPITVLVGISRLLKKNAANASPASPLPKEGGVLPLPSTLTSDGSGHTGAVSYQEYPVVHGDWLPVSGTVPQGTTRVTVQMTSAQGNWTYRLPVSPSGQFSALLRSPFSGQVSVAYVTGLLEQLNQKGSYTFDPAYTEFVPKTLSRRNIALLNSGFMDGNLWPEGVWIAKTLDHRAGGGVAGAMAMSTFVSEYLHYNVPMGEGKIPYAFEDVTQAARQKLGVCMQYAEMTAVLLHDAGIPAQTVIGTVRNGSEHEWVQAEIDGRWIPLDPTWDAPIGGVSEVVTNDYALHLTTFAKDRTVQEVGSWQ
ncbi:MAG: transglutaminase-like domain-containing protein [Alicyclobacillaceae bacterium]|nr:transglutaminase-like domain-containing protein [Alicyclobacillaceae bacterium]